jgi:hypothetical protein
MINTSSFSDETESVPDSDTSDDSSVIMFIPKVKKVITDEDFERSIATVEDRFKQNEMERQRLSYLVKDDFYKAMDLIENIFPPPSNPTTQREFIPILFMNILPEVKKEFEDIQAKLMSDEKA